MARARSQGSYLTTDDFRDYCVKGQAKSVHAWNVSLFTLDEASQTVACRCCNVDSISVEHAVGASRWKKLVQHVKSATHMRAADCMLWRADQRQPRESFISMTYV
jgi:hypothetical protein